MGKPQVSVQKKKRTYQSFPDQKGGSLSFDKLRQLRLPSVDGGSFLDVGCNEGFFCGFALHQGASRAVGIDMSAEFVSRAKQRFPKCEFLQQNWDVLPEGPFDVILLASALHYAEDQPALIKKLVDHLTPEGTLVLELGIVSGPQNEWVAVKRSIDTRYFPTMEKLKEVLAPYAYKFIGLSVNQNGDPVNRFVFHIRRRRPFAFLLMMPSSYGKTYIANTLFPNTGIPLKKGDLILDEISKGKTAVSKRFKAFLDKNYKKGEVARTTRELLAADMIDDYLTAWAGESAVSDIAFEGFIPEKSHEMLCDRLRDRGYFPVTLNWQLIGKSVTSPVASATASAEYYQYLSSKPDGAPAKTDARPVHQSGLYKVWKTEGQAGVVDSIRVKGADVSISGWSVDKMGRLPRQLVVELMDRKFVFDDVASVRRPDVQKVFGLVHANVGFVVKLKLDEAAGDAEIGKQILVRPGSDGKGIGNAFRVAPKLRGES